MDKKQVWENIKKREYNIPFQKEIFALIENNLDRVQFIKDHIGLRDILFISEVGTEKYYVSTLFSAFDIDADPSYSMAQNEEAFHQKYTEKSEDVLKDLEEFIMTTDRTLFVGIGFIETTNRELHEEMVPIEQNGMIFEVPKYIREIIMKIQNGEAETEAEASKQLRKFPDWYEEYCKMPEEVTQLTRLEEKRIQKETFEKKKTYLMQQIDQSLDQKNETEFKRLSYLYKELMKKKH